VGKLGEFLGMKDAYGIRNRKEALAWLSDDYICLVFASAETGGVVEHVGTAPRPEHSMAVDEAFLLRNESPMKSLSSGSTEPVPIPAIRPGEIPAGSSGSITVTQPENALLLRYQNWIARELTTWSVKHPRSTASLRIDAYDVATHTLIEAKASSHRTSVLHAMAQLLDYCRLIPKHQREVILLAARPEQDLCELAHSLTIGICFEEGEVFKLLT